MWRRTQLCLPSGGGTQCSLGIDFTPQSSRAGGAAAKIRAEGDGAGNAGLSLWTATGGSAAAAVERVRIGTDGNVGIGTGVPRAKLEVNGSFYCPGTIIQVVINKITTETILTSATSYTATTILATITPKFNNSILMIHCNVAIEVGGTGGVFLIVYRDDTQSTDYGAPLGSEHGYYYQNTLTDMYVKQSFTMSVISGNTLATTFKIYGKRHGAPSNLRVGCPSNAGSYSGRSEIIIYEITQ